MPANYPKFDKKINDHIDRSRFLQSKNRPGTIMSYNSHNNTATILLDEKFSSVIGNAIMDVPCPFIYGVQSVAPAPGTRCMVAFRDENESEAYVMMYYNEPRSYKNSINKNIYTGIPKFME